MGGVAGIGVRGIATVRHWSRESLRWSVGPGQKHRGTRPSLRRLACPLSNDFYTQARQRYGRKSFKARRVAPSNSLVAVLAELGVDDALPAPSSTKPDWSYNSPVRVSATARRKAWPRRPGPSLSLTWRPSSITLPDLLAKYLKFVHPRLHAAEDQPHAQVDLDAALRGVFSRSVMAFLGIRGYAPDDVATWAWILTAKDAERATLRLSMAATRSRRSSPGYDTRSRRLPIFVFMFLLRRPQIDAKSLRMLLAYAWGCLQGTPPWVRTLPELRPIRHIEMDGAGVAPGVGILPSFRQVTCTTMNESTVMIMVVRLLRHARQVWPQAVVNITEMIKRHLRGRAREADPAVMARITFIYNRALSLLSIPSHQNPFLSIPYQQSAQLNLIEAMSQFSPPLSITREGYRAVASVQLAHQKTPLERRRATEQAGSWPPWREERLGIDADEQGEENLSRAAQTIRKMQEAGYQKEKWEKIASILAGWDTDGTPTIQTRTAVPRPLDGPKLPSSLDPAKRRSAQSPEPDDAPEIWAARIRATRTLREAWACFLAHEDRELRRSGDVYAAMLEKVLFDWKRRLKRKSRESMTSVDDRTNHNLPGDGLEVHPSPPSSRGGVDVGADPPELAPLYDRMIHEGIKPPSRCLALLISNVDSLTLAVKLLRSSGRLHPHSIAILTDRGVMNERRTELDYKALRAIPTPILAAFVKLLCHLPTDYMCTTPFAYETESRRSPSYRFRGTNPSGFALVSPLVQACQLVHVQQPRYRPAWNALLYALSRRGVWIGTRLRGPKALLHDLMCWRLSCNLVRQMNNINLGLDQQGLHYLCIVLEKSVLACLEIKRGHYPEDEGYVLSPLFPGLPDKDREPIPLRSEMENVLGRGSDHLKHAFGSFVGTSYPTDGNGSGLEQLPRRTTEESQTSVRFAFPPSLLGVPGPVVIHSYIRALGFSRDYHGLISLVRWMAFSTTELQTVVNGFSNGRKVLRRCIVALRVFLERSWDTELIEADGSPIPSPGAPAEIVEAVREIVASAGNWGDWPEDEEVLVYCNSGRSILNM